MTITAPIDTITLGGQAYPARALTLRQLRQWLPKVQDINATLPDMQFGDATFDVVIGFVGAVIGRKPEDMEDLPMSLREIQSAFVTACQLAGLVEVQVPAGTASGEAQASGGTSTPSTASSPADLGGDLMTSTT